MKYKIFKSRSSLSGETNRHFVVPVNKKEKKKYETT